MKVTELETPAVVVDLDVLEQNLRRVSEKVNAAISDLSAAGLECAVVSARSTPTAFSSHLVQSLTEIRPGTYLFNDRNTMGVGACERDHWALRIVATVVVSTALPGRAAIDRGTKTF